jgi:hypothetical protein
MSLVCTNLAIAVSPHPNRIVPKITLRSTVHKGWWQDQMKSNNKVMVAKMMRSARVSNDHSDVFFSCLIMNERQNILFRNYYNSHTYTQEIIS